jgi:hypothetical protein
MGLHHQGGKGRARTIKPGARRSDAFSSKSWIYICIHAGNEKGSQVCNPIKTVIANCVITALYLSQLADQRENKPEGCNLN